jgi:hypothetical protein
MPISRCTVLATVMLIATTVESGEQNNYMNDMNTCLTREYVLVWISV